MTTLKAPQPAQPRGHVEWMEGADRFTHMEQQAVPHVIFIIFYMLGGKIHWSKAAQSKSKAQVIYQLEPDEFNT